MDEDLQNDEYFRDSAFPTMEEILEESVQQHKEEIFEWERHNCKQIKK